MRALSPPNIESELSYAYLHAVASSAGMACSMGNRHEDNNGIDAIVTVWGPFEGGGYLSEVTIKVQLKATIKEPYDDGESLSYFLSGVSRYDDLRSQSVASARILVVIFLPEHATQWLLHSSDQLALKRCAYWKSLRCAPPTTNNAGVTIKLPKSQMFSAESLKKLAADLSHPKFPTYTE